MALAREGFQRNIANVDGYWQITKEDDGVSITYELHADPGGGIPNWLVNSSVVDTPFGILSGLKRRLTESP